MSKYIHQRRWFQFSIKSLLSLMLVVAVFFAGRMSLNKELQLYRRQVEQINKDRAMRREILSQLEKRVQEYQRRNDEQLEATDARWKMESSTSISN